MSADEKLLLERLEKGKVAPPEPEEAPEPRRQVVREVEFEGRGEEKPRSRASEPTFAGCLRLLKWVTRLIVWSVLLIGGGLIAAMHLLGQSNVTVAALMYAPPLPWLVAPALLLIPALLFDWKSGLVLLLSVPAYLYWHTDFIPQGPGSEVRRSMHTVKVLTWNRGQAKKASLSQLKRELRPDLIFLQDAKLTHYQNNPDYSDFPTIHGVGDFVMLSRWPALSMDPLFPPRDAAVTERRAWGVRCVVAAAGRRCVIYNLHLPTPRDALESYMRGAFLWGILGHLPLGDWEAKRLHYEAFWQPYLTFAENFRRQLAQEIGPVLVLGDFNTPPFGPIHQGLTDGLIDCHRAAGSGFGYTFPGDTRNPLAFFQPWLRLDRVHASDHWKPLSCRPVEAPAQHLPLMVELDLPPPTLVPPHVLPDDP